MRVLRVLLALLLMAGPIQAQPVVDLLSHCSIPIDETAASAPEGDAPQGSGKRLAALEADLSLVAESLEGFAHPQDSDKALLAARPRLPAGTVPFFRDRSSALDALYRTLAVVDYTWALRFPNPPCAPADKRAALLRSDDGLFLDPFSGKSSAWMTALLGPVSKGKSLETALDQAAISAAPSQSEYARLRARHSLITRALESEDAVGEARAKLYCKRAETRVKLASANRLSGPVLAARSTGDAVSRRGLVILAGKTVEGLEARGAGVVIETKSGIRILTDRRLGTGEVAALIDGRNVPVPLSVDREDEKSGLLLLRPDGDLGEALILADAAPKKDDLVFAFAHSERLGAWTKTQGLVTSAGPDQFQSDAVADASMTGGAVLNEEGRVAGLLVLRRAEGSAVDWPAAVPAPALRAWLDGGDAPAALPVALTDEGTTKILTASRPLLQSLAVGDGATNASYGFDTQTQWGSVHATCMANCTDSSPSSSYPDNGSAELGQAMGKLLALGAEALIFKGIPALFRGIGSLFKSSPRAAPVRTVEAARVKQVEPEKPKPEPEYKIHLYANKSAPKPNESVKFIATLTRNRDDMKLDGITINFKINERQSVSGVTDASGKVILTVEPPQAEISHDSLDEESRKHPEMINAGRETVAEGACRTVLIGATGIIAVSALAASVPLGPGGMILTADVCLKVAGGTAAAGLLTCAAVFGAEKALMPQPVVPIQPVPSPSKREPAPTRVGPEAAPPQVSKTDAVDPAREGDDRARANNDSAHDALKKAEREQAAEEGAGGGEEMTGPADPGNEPPDLQEPDEKEPDGGIRLTRGGKQKIGNLSELKDKTVAEAIRIRGGGQQQIRHIQTGMGEKTVGEIANAAARGDREAARALKMIKQAARKGQRNY